MDGKSLSLRLLCNSTFKYRCHPLGVAVLDSWMKFLILGSHPTIVTIWEVDQQMKIDLISLTLFSNNK